MVKAPRHLTNNAFKILKVTASGGATVLLSTFTSCYLAVMIEKTAHRVQYHFFPHWYKDVNFALGLDLHKKGIVSSSHHLHPQEENNDELEVDSELALHHTTDDEDEMDTVVTEKNDYEDLRDMMNKYSNHWNPTRTTTATRTIDETQSSRIFVDNTLFSTSTSNSFDESTMRNGGQEQQQHYLYDRNVNNSFESSSSFYRSKCSSCNFDQAKVDYSTTILSDDDHPTSSLPQHHHTGAASIFRMNSDSDEEGEESVSNNNNNRLRSLMKKVSSSSSSENLSSVLHNCAMTA